MKKLILLTLPVFMLLTAFTTVDKKVTHPVSFKKAASVIRYEFYADTKNTYRFETQTNKEYSFDAVTGAEWSKTVAVEDGPQEAYFRVDIADASSRPGMITMNIYQDGRLVATKTIDMRYANRNPDLSLSYSTSSPSGFQSTM